MTPLSTDTHYTNGYNITYDNNGRGVKILKVEKDGREINADTMLKVKLAKEISEYLQMCREDMEYEAMIVEKQEA